MIKSAHISSLIELKEASAEAGLPGFADFREAAHLGDRSEVQRLVEAAPEDLRPKYADRLNSMLGRMVEQKDFDAARAIIDASLSVDALRSNKRAQEELLAGT